MSLDSARPSGPDTMMNAMNVAEQRKDRPTQATVVATERPDEYRLVFLSPAARLLARQRQRRLTQIKGVKP